MNAFDSDMLTEILATKIRERGDLISTLHRSVDISSPLFRLHSFGTLAKNGS